MLCSVVMSFFQWRRGSENPNSAGLVPSHSGLDRWNAFTCPFNLSLTLRRASVWTLSHCGGISSCNVRWHKINPPFLSQPGKENKYSRRHSARDYGVSRGGGIYKCTMGEDALFFTTAREREMGAGTIWMTMVVMVCLLPSNAIVWQIINAAKSRWQWTEMRLWWRQIENCDLKWILILHLC